MHATLPLLVDTDFPPLRRRRLETLQVNVGYVCNQTCLHCHVNAGPTRTESMSAETAERVLDYLEASGATTLDITGGAPELNPNFVALVRGARSKGVRVIDRCNLTVLTSRDRKASRASSPTIASTSWPRSRATRRSSSTASAARACTKRASRRCRR